MKNFPPPPPPPRRRYKRKAGFLFSKYLRVKEKKYGEKKGKGVGTISGEGKKLVEVLFWKFWVIIQKGNRRDREEGRKEGDEKGEASVGGMQQVWTIFFELPFVPFFSRSCWFFRYPWIHWKMNWISFFSNFFFCKSHRLSYILRFRNSIRVNESLFFHFSRSKVSFQLYLIIILYISIKGRTCILWMKILLLVLLLTWLSKTDSKEKEEKEEAFLSQIVSINSSFSSCTNRESSSQSPLPPFFHSPFLFILQGVVDQRYSINQGRSKGRKERKEREGAIGPGFCRDAEKSN